MNLESLEYRVDELEYQKLQIAKQIRQLEFEKDKIRGKLEEVWDMIDGYKEKNEYGYSTLEGGVKVLKLPQIGSDKGIADALGGKVAAEGGYDLETTRKYRKQRHREDAQMAANVMDGMNPDTSEEDESWRLCRA
jgi:hypothetical protein